MSVKLTWYGHACFLFEASGHRILVDPFLTDNPQASVKAGEVRADFIVVSHGHGDHLGDTVAIAKRTGATVISNFEIVGWLQNQGLKKLHPQHIGGGFDHPFGRLKLTQALHGSALPDGSYGGNPAGLLFSFDELKIYHACDTGLFGDMELIGDEGIDLAILPIGDNFTMGPDDALRAVQLIRPRKVVPIHYNTFDMIKQDPHAWAMRVGKETDARAIVLDPGQGFEL
ncbi:MAG: metal-dependent hydrolase [Candidatus Krumholzibacteriia bacterium]